MGVLVPSAFSVTLQFRISRATVGSSSALSVQPKMGRHAVHFAYLTTFLAILAKVVVAVILGFITLFGLIPWLIGKILRW